MLCLLCCPQSLAVDISLAGLLGEDVYNFGELLLHPIVSGRGALPLGGCGGGAEGAGAGQSCGPQAAKGWGVALLHPIVSGRAALPLGGFCVCGELLLQPRVGR